MTSRNGPISVLLLLALFMGPMQAEKQHKEAAHTYVYDVRPQVRIPVEPLGYRPPGELPAFSYYALVALHYIDATRLLFSFNTTGLLQRDPNCSPDESERMVRSVVLDLPSGKVEKQVQWELYDFSQFLWSLGDGRFLLRRCSQLEMVDRSLVPRPFINMGGTLETVIFSPDHSVLAVEEKPATPAPKRQRGVPGIRPILPPHAADVLPPQPAKELNIDFLRVHPLGIIASSHVQRAVYIPILAQGFLEMLAAPHDQWVVNLQPYAGSQRQVAMIHSICQPQLTAITDDVVLVTMCPNPHEIDYQAYNLQGSLLWQMPAIADRYSPEFILTRDGAHFAIESLHATHPIAALDPLTSQDVDAQIIDIYDTLTGVLIASFRTTPVYTAGRNADFSPDGAHMAILHDGAIEIHDLNALAKDRQALPR